MPVLKLALPKGSLEKPTIDLFRRAGFDLNLPERAHHFWCDDPEIAALLLRPQEMGRYCELGQFDAAISGHDWIVESGADLVEVTRLVYSKVSQKPVKWVLAVPEESSIHSVKDLAGKLVSTELVGVVKRYLEGHGVEAVVEFSHGATEIKARDFADAIVDATETGNSLRANRLRIVDTVIESTPRLVANKAAWADPWKRAKLGTIAMLLKGATAAQGMVGVKLNCPAEAEAAICAILPGHDAPTVSPIRREGWIAIEAVARESEMKRLIPLLRDAGAHGILEYPITKLID